LYRPAGFTVGSGSAVAGDPVLDVVVSRLNSLPVTYEPRVLCSSTVRVSSSIASDYVRAHGVLNDPTPCRSSHWSPHDAACSQLLSQESHHLVIARDNIPTLEKSVFPNLRKFQCRNQTTPLPSPRTPTARPEAGAKQPNPASSATPEPPPPHPSSSSSLHFHSRSASPPPPEHPSWPDL